MRADLMPRKTGLALALAALLGACGDERLEGPVTARVVVYEGSDPGTEVPRFALADRALPGLESLEELRGPFVRLRRGGTLTAREVQGSVLVDGSFSGGHAPDLRYDVEGGVVVPRDYPTLAMLSAYHQFDRIFEALPRVTGIDPAEGRARWGRFDVLFEPELRVSSGGTDVSLTVKLNAFFVPGARQFGLARRSSLEDVPFAADLRVLAHEFGHALFEDRFFGGPYEACRPSAADARWTPARLALDPGIGGMNEGFSDFLSFAITGATNSLGGWRVVRPTRSLAHTTFTFDQAFVETSKGGPCGGGIYCFGTIFARALFQTYVERGGAVGDAEARGAFSRDVVAALGETRRILLERGTLPPPGAEVRACEQPDEVRGFAVAPVVGAFLDAFAAGLPAAVQPAVCARFIKGFGPQVFGAGRRITCKEAP